MEAKTWDNFILKHHGSFLQSWAWGEFQAAYGRPVERILTATGAVQYFIYPLALGKTYLFSPYGPVGSPASPSTSSSESRRAEDSENFMNTLKEIAKKYHALFWRYERGGESMGGKQVKEIHPQYTWILKLQSLDKLLAEMKPKWRYNIRLAEKKGVRVHISQDPNDIERLYPLLQNTAQRQGIRLHAKKYYQLMVSQLGQAGMLKLYLAEYHDKIIAGNIIVSFGDTMTYLHGGSDQAYHTVMAPHLLQWQAIQAAQQTGCTSYDFFGIAPPDQPQHPWAGITRFKQGFGGKLVSYPGTYDLVLQPMWYTMYTIYGYCHRRRR